MVAILFQNHRLLSSCDCGFCSFHISYFILHNIMWVDVSYNYINDIIIAILWALVVCHYNCTTMCI